LHSQLFFNSQLSCILISKPVTPCICPFLRSQRKQGISKRDEFFSAFVCSLYSNFNSQCPLHPRVNIKSVGYIFEYFNALGNMHTIFYLKKIRKKKLDVRNKTKRFRCTEYMVLDLSSQVGLYYID
jgi:hypothetical protein